MTNEEILNSHIHVDINDCTGEFFYVEREVFQLMDAARKDEAISFSKFLSGFLECQAGWMKKFEHPNDKEKFYTIEQVYEMFKQQK